MSRPDGAAHRAAPAPAPAPASTLPTVAVIGATGTGKSAVALRIAERLADDGLRAEIVNADAMQLYRGMDIGTAKLPPGERAAAPHHLFDVLDVTDTASVAAYQRAARRVVGEIVGRGAVPIVVGGSGLYVSALLHEFAFPGRDDAVRARLEAELASHGLGALAARLRLADPATASAVDLQNPRRVIRALEIAELRAAPGAAASQSAGAETRPGGTLPERPAPVRPTIELALGIERADLVGRLDARVEGMWTAGLVDEVRSLVPAGLERGITASRAIGYAQALGQLRGELSEADAVAETQRLTRRYARRQVSWFRRYPDAVWADAADGVALETTIAAVADRVGAAGDTRAASIG